MANRNQFKKDMKAWVIKNKAKDESEFKFWVTINLIDSSDANLFLNQSIYWFRNQRKVLPPGKEGPLR